MSDMVERWRLEAEQARVARYAKLVGGIRLLIEEFYVQQHYPSPAAAAVPGEPAPRRAVITRWVHLDGSGCMAGFLADTPRSSSGSYWWCTEDQKYLQPEGGAR